MDLTAQLDRNRREILDDEVPEVVAARAVIEQAKGILMFVYWISAEQAFGVLRWRSQDTNTRPHHLTHTGSSEVLTHLTRAGVGA
ncbi:ANTAR domain-containing protein [Nocardia sp. BMG111209]|uniref:ANTAR domain-containing protein n=1 Tax=Nocardia sp. BMG111209 TaxID=1160137 RepID=UPI00037C2A82|nr:ANTAR domain-containing protein [Nocardia sp. BMG111209]